MTGSSTARDYRHSAAPAQIRGFLEASEIHFTPRGDGKLNYDGGAYIIDWINQSIWSGKKGGAQETVMTLEEDSERAWNAH